jgi:restriction endonuclease Mrr
MAIPHLPKVRIHLWAELEKLRGIGERQDVIEVLEERFQLSQAEREQRDPTGAKTFSHRVDTAVAQSRIVSWIEPVASSGRGVWKLTEEYFSCFPIGERSFGVSFPTTTL